MKYKAVFISDVHLGSRGSKAKELNDFLKSIETDRLFLVGDILDGWVLKNRWYFPKEHMNVVRRILKMSKNTEVIYITGNHDEFLREVSNGEFSFGNIKVVDSYIYEDALVIHGDIFDVAMKWGAIAHIGSYLYEVLLWMNTINHKIREKLNLPYWSLSKKIKESVKGAVKYIGKYEDTATEYVSSKNYKKIVCGHIHMPSYQVKSGIEYYNCGDWVENCSALVQHKDGEYELIVLGLR